MYRSTLPLIRILYDWVLSKEVSSTIFKVFGMTQPGIWTQVSWIICEHTLSLSLSLSLYIYIYIYIYKEKEKQRDKLDKEI